MQQVATTNGTTTTTAYLGSLEEVSTTGSTTTTTAYYGSLAESVNGALSYTLSDGLGSVTETATPSGVFVPPTLATQLYAPYGSVRYQSGTLPTDHGFTGQRSDAATSGLDYDNARYYDPIAGQFTSADTTLAGGLNRYGYVDSNPETWVDPSGHELRPGDEGTGAYLSGGGDDVGGGGGGGGSESGNGDPTTPLPTANGSELSYAYDDGTSATVYFDAPEGQIDGVDSPNGQLLESNAQIEAQAEANSADRLSQGDQPHGETNPQTATDTSPSGTTSGTSADASHPTVTLGTSSVRVSQSSVNGVQEIADSMQTNGWAGDPIDVVQMPDEGLTSVNNTRVVAADETGIDVQATIHAFDEPLPEDQVGRFTTRRGGVPSTWGDAVMNRIGGQNSTFRNSYPYGAPVSSLSR